MSAVVFDDSSWPVIIVRFPPSCTDAEFDAYLDGLKSRLLRGDRTCTIMDAREAGLFPPVQRKRQADWLATNRALLLKAQVGTAFVITNPVVRGVLTAITWIQPMPSEHTVVATMAEAERWAWAQLRKAGVTRP